MKYAYTVGNYLPTTVSYKAERTYEVEINPKWWPYLVLEWFLKKIGAKNKFLSEIVFEEVNIDIQNLTYSLRNYLLNWYEKYGKVPELILVGRDHYLEIVNYNGQFSLALEATVQICDEGSCSWMGYKIKLIPWMNGVLPLDEDILRN